MEDAMTASAPYSRHRAHGASNRCCAGSGRADCRSTSKWSVGSDRSVLSLWSRGSVLSIASEGSVLSIGSIGSAGSVASVGSALSALSIGSWLSVGSALSAQSRWSIMSWRSSGGRMDTNASGPRCHPARTAATALLVAGAIAGALATVRPGRRAGSGRSVG
ncbi:hypothetical protein [Streptodolium elevatio]|uniref:hypothetical protein n=1 Tax=Streptodolium elevatio TaxID=3157996 RepID=UPI003F4D1F60